MKLYSKLFFLCLALIMFTLSGCSFIKPANEMPNEKPKSFGFIFNYGVNAKNQLDTVNGKFTKDMIAEPSITTDLKLTDEDMNSIYSEMREINILNYPEKFNPKSNTKSTPYITYNIKIMTDGKEKNILWEDENMSKTKDAVQLRTLFKKIEDIINKKEEYKKLPAAKGGYH